jgi:hypothetical protein
MIISTKSVRQIDWNTVDFEIVGTVGGKFRLCVITQEVHKSGKPTGRWIIRYSFQNENGKPFGCYSNSLEEAKWAARCMLEGLLGLLTEGAIR